jgi:hypothetical protein
MTDPSPARKSGRFWLLAPLVLLAVAALAWSGVWLWLSRETTSRLDAARADLQRSGWTLSWASCRVEGYPFRLDVRLDQPRFVSAAGRGLSAPRLEAEAYAYRPQQWLLAFPEGLTIERPLTGPTRVTGERIRASVVAGGGVPRVSVEGSKLSFTPAGAPILFPLASAGRFEAHLRPHPDGRPEAGLLVRIDEARAAQGTLLQRIGGDPKGRLLWESVVEQPEALRGADWPAAVRNWMAEDGRIRVLQGEAVVGGASAKASAGELTAGGDGRLRGFLDLAIRRAPQALLSLRGAPKVDPAAATVAAAVAEARQTQEVAPMRLVFEAGVVTVGPVALAPAPKVY